MYMCIRLYQHAFVPPENLNVMPMLKCRFIAKGNGLVSLWNQRNIAAIPMANYLQTITAPGGRVGVVRVVYSFTLISLILYGIQYLNKWLLLILYMFLGYQFYFDVWIMPHVSTYYCFV